MKPLAVLLLALCCASFAHAQSPAPDRDSVGGLDAGAERDRIRTERAAAQARFEEASRACRARFAVTDCINGITREHNAALAELRRQERVLNQEERRRRAASHLRDLDERNSPERQREAAERRQRAVEEQKHREEVAAEKAAKKAAADAAKAGRAPRAAREPSGPSGPQGTPRAPGAPRNHALTPEEIAKNRASYEARLREAEAHRAAVQERIAKRSKRAASSLPPPQ